MRNACGCNDHPDSRLFIQMYKLISTYSLVKPPRGSNIDSGEMLHVLLNINDVSKPEAQEKIEQFQRNIDDFIENQSISENVFMNIRNEHNYSGSSSAEVILAYMAGYVARKSLRFTKCLECRIKLQSDQCYSRNAFINILSKGHLMYPSNDLYLLIEM